MDIQLIWRTPIHLVKAPRGAAQDFVIPKNTYKRVPETPGIYVFCRKFGGSYHPIYIGEGQDVRDRIEWHLIRNVALMKALREEKNGGRAILVGEIVPEKGRDPKKTRRLVERTMIAEAVDMGYSLVNLQLTTTYYHKIVSLGNTNSRGPFSRTYSVPIA